MNLLRIFKAVFVIMALGFLLSSAACKTVTRENIISSINTGIGVTLAENPKTEMYEAKIGYIRSQFYSIPTGKTVENENKDDGSAEKGRRDMRTNEANVTPEVISGIRMKSGVEHLLIGVDVSESFAVGKVAVMSPAAVAMYVADSRNAKIAEKASEAVSESSKAAEKAAQEIMKEQKYRKDKIIQYFSKDGNIDNNGNIDKDKLKDLFADATWKDAAINEVKNSDINLTKLQELLNGTWDGRINYMYDRLPPKAK